MTSSIDPSRTASSSRTNFGVVEPRGRVFALQIVLAQLVVSGVLSIFGFLFSSQTAIAILSGGMICTLANLWFALVAFRPALGKQPSEMLAAFYLGEIGKFVVTMLLFLVLFKKFALFKQANYALLVFLTYAVVQCTVWAYPLARSWLYKP